MPNLLGRSLMSVIEEGYAKGAFGAEYLEGSASKIRNVQPKPPECIPHQITPAVTLHINIDNNTSLEHLKHIKEILQCCKS